MYPVAGAFINNGMSGCVAGLIIENNSRLNMEQNCIPECIFAMAHDNYDEFLSERRKLMAQKIKEYYYSL